MKGDFRRRRGRSDLPSNPAGQVPTGIVGQEQRHVPAVGADLRASEGEVVVAPLREDAHRERRTDGPLDGAPAAALRAARARCCLGRAVRGLRPLPNRLAVGPTGEATAAAAAEDETVVIFRAALGA